MIAAGESNPEGDREDQEDREKDLEVRAGERLHGKRPAHQHGILETSPFAEPDEVEQAERRPVARHDLNAGRGVVVGGGEREGRGRHQSGWCASCDLPREEPRSEGREGEEQDVGQVVEGDVIQIERTERGHLNRQADQRLGVEQRGGVWIEDVSAERSPRLGQTATHLLEGPREDQPIGVVGQARR